MKSAKGSGPVGLARGLLQRPTGRRETGYGCSYDGLKEFVVTNEKKRSAEQAVSVIYQGEGFSSNQRHGCVHDGTCQDVEKRKENDQSMFCVPASELSSAGTV